MADPADATSNGTSFPAQGQEGSATSGDSKADPLREHFQFLLPLLQQEWPQITREHLEGTRGSMEELVQLIASQTSHTRVVIRAQLLELADHVVRVRQGTNPWDQMVQPLEEQLGSLIEELRQDLQPRLQQAVRQRPLLSLSAAVLAGFLAGLLLAGSRRSQ